MACTYLHKNYSELRSECQIFLVNYSDSGNKWELYLLLVHNHKKINLLSSTDWYIANKFHSNFDIMQLHLKSANLSLDVEATQLRTSAHQGQAVYATERKIVILAIHKLHGSNWGHGGWNAQLHSFHGSYNILYPEDFVQVLSREWKARGHVSV